MYTPPSFREARPAVLHDWIRAYPFATLVTGGAGVPQATHLPLLLDAERGCLRGHMARANRHWQAFGDGPVLAVFHGPHAYVSPTWYEAAFAVPTWNYVAVHVSGRAAVVDDAAQVRRLLDDLIAASDRHGWRMPWQDERADAMLDAIVAFEVAVDAIEGKAKLGQNRPAADQARTLTALRDSPAEGDRALARFISAYRPEEPAP